MSEQSTSHASIPYGRYVLVGFIVVAGLTLWLYLWSSRQIRSSPLPTAVPTPVAQESSESQIGAGDDDITVLGAQAEAVDMRDLNDQIGIIDQPQ